MNFDLFEEKSRAYNGKKQLESFKQLLDSKSVLSESKDVKPFFKANLALAAYVGTALNGMVMNRFKFEYPFGSFFQADLVLHDSHKNSYLYIEFESAEKDSLFSGISTRQAPNFSPKFQKGFFQLIDWLWYTQTQINQFKTNLNAHPKIDALLLIGRDQFMDTPQQSRENPDRIQSNVSRLKWFEQAHKIDGKSISVLTYDALYNMIDRRITTDFS